MNPKMKKLKRFFIQFTATSGTEEPFSYLDYPDVASMVHKYLGENTIVTVPSTHDSLPVTAISDETFLNNTTIEQTVIPEGVEMIY